MKTTKTYVIGLATLALLFVGGVNQVMAQTDYQGSGAVKIKVSGTSNIHDWDMNSDKATCSVAFKADESGNLVQLTNLSFAMVAETLKSEHSGMDKNAYKAMTTNKYPNMAYHVSSAAVKATGTNTYTIYTKGKLTIRDVTREVSLTATAKFDPSTHVLTCSGSVKISMKDYNVEAPNIMFGAIKTGDAVTVYYDFSIKLN